MNKAWWCLLGLLVQKTQVDVEADVREIVLVTELQSGDIHRCLQKINIVFQVHNYFAVLSFYIIIYFF